VAHERPEQARVWIQGKAAPVSPPPVFPKPFIFFPPPPGKEGVIVCRTNGECACESCVEDEAGDDAEEHEAQVIDEVQPPTPPP
jgi:hypothetical protein